MVAQPLPVTVEKRLPLEVAQALVGSAADLIRSECERLEIAGSIRRGTPYVKDAEIVAIAKPGLLPLLDRLCELGTIEKALYRGKAPHRWGPLYRGFQYGEIKIEVFLADGDNWGFQKWLRSGPGEANKYVMAYISHKNPAIRFQEGYGWYSAAGWKWRQKGKSKEFGWQADDRVKLHIPDEETVFRLLGMPYLPPGERSERAYKQLMQWNRAHRWPDFTAFIAPEPVAQPVIVPAAPRQMALFGDALLDMEVRHIDEKVSGKDGRRAVIPWLHGDASMDGEAWRAQVYAGAIQRTEQALKRAREEGRMYSSYARRVMQLERELAVLRGMA